ncbi:MAG: YicC family protein [Candidatus Marinimicrobia bacterium CG_4_10_14_0_2_um_filter_48_9]|nr:MAG: YicC family protein [Candidatus Marinimicrobia bacterium CG_4_10_14_0_2_um_filter_48_9]PJA51885.1 MAG: YicC family protein [Candidatus Marinimicrobia bacterium CG_4_9_14_3_um_filter_48_9]
MLKSMTGFGKSEVKHEGLDLTIEVRSVNSRFLEMNFRQPRMLAEFEDLARPIVQNRIPRGKLQISLNLPNEASLHATPIFNEELAKEYLKIAETAKALVGAETTLTTDQLLQMPDIIQFEPKIPDQELFFKACVNGLNQALDALDDMRSVEGQHLENALIEQLNVISQLLEEIETNCAARIPMVMEKLQARIQSALKDTEVDERRLEQEWVIWADKLDISEELVRFKAHILHFRDIMENDPNAGRRLNFLLQEMNREANTIGSKAYSSSISYHVVELKSEVEKIREQIQNIQ